MQAQEQHATAEKILSVTSKLFAERGFANVSIRDICRETGTTAPVIYYYFGSKKGLFDAVARKQISMADFISKLGKSSRDPNPKKALGSFIDGYLSSFPEHSFDPGLYMRDSATLDKKAAQMAYEDLEKLREMASEMIRRAIARGQFRKTDVEMATDCLLGMLNRVIFQHLHFARSADRDSYRRFVTDFFFRAME